MAAAGTAGQPAGLPLRGVAQRRDGTLALTGVAALACACLVSSAQVEAGPVVCPFRLATGLPCPGCGLARSWVLAAHGDLAGSVERHPFGAPLMLGTAVLALVVAGRWRRGKPPLDIARQLARPVSLVVVAAWLVWWALVSLPQGV